VVETQREATLLKENGTLRGQLAGARRDATKAEHALAGTQDGLRNAERDVAGANAEIEALRDQLAAAEADAASARTRSMTDRRIALAVADLIALGAVVMLVRARRPRSGRRSDLTKRRGFVAAVSRGVRR
jgi:septal ring factor EnvC (AmiA/AmiB activator)